MKILPFDNSYRTFCDLTSGYRTFRVISEAIESGIIDLLEVDACSIDVLLEKTTLKTEEGRRFIALLVNVGLLEEYDGLLYLSRFSRSYLGMNSAVSQRHMLEFEPLLMKNWGKMRVVLQEGQGALNQEQPPEEYRRRLQLFQQAMTEAARIRAGELWEALTGLPENGLIIDIGAGDGSYMRAFLERHPGWRAIACDLPDVCASAAPDAIPENLSFHPCNILERRELASLVADHHAKADILLFSNICHCYSQEENRALLQQAAAMLTDDGLLIVHDFFRDANSFGAMYDLHMLVNTFNGRSYAIDETADMLRSAGLWRHTTVALPSYSHAIIATRHRQYTGAGSSLQPLLGQAHSLGFHAVAELVPAGIKPEAWVTAKCAYGCSQYGKRWSCPPHSMERAGFQELLGCYSRALLVAGQPPLRGFQERLLELEKGAFLGGFKKALAFTGGPCSWCESCPDDRCTYPEKRRPSLESCGCDVFALAESCGIPVAPLRSSDDFVQYIGLLLVD